jgi:hypothetical protein
MIPTSIDGTDITGATIDGTDVQEITVDGDTVFSAAADVVALGNLAAWYRMEGDASDETVNQPTSADTTDYGGTVNGGSFVSSDVVDRVTGTTGQAYKVTGNQFIEYPFTDPPGKGTICLWAYVDDKSGDIGYLNNDGGQHFQIRFSDFSNYFVFQVNNTGALLYNNPDADEWYHIAITIGTSQVEMFIDGVSEDTNSSFDPVFDRGVNYQSMEAPNGAFDGNGRLDDLRLYDTVLTNQQISDIFDNTKPAGK